jgi:Fe-S-cluster-containing dehydrogenase component
MAVTRRDFIRITAGSGALLAANASSVHAASQKTAGPEALGILYDATCCIGCKSCMVNCKKYNSIPGGALFSDGSIPYEYTDTDRIYDAPTDLSAKSLSIIKAYKSGSGENKDMLENGYSFIKQNCFHCLDPACASACPVGALKKDAVSGAVTYTPNKCIGCRYCQVACPFAIPKLGWEGDSAQIRKCQLCHHRYAAGGYAACCEFCPTGASLFGKVTELREEANRRMALTPGSYYDYPLGRIDSGKKAPKKVSHYVKHVYGLSEAGGTQYMLLAGVPFEKLGLNPRITDQVLPELTWNYIKKVPALIVALLIAGSASYYATRKKEAEK